MEILGERPAWSMNDSEKLSRLDATVAELNRLKTYALHLVGDLDASGYAKDIGAGDTARFLSLRYRIDSVEARRDVRLARSLAKYEAVAAALPNPAAPFSESPTTDTPADPDEAGADAPADPDEATLAAEAAGADDAADTDAPVDSPADSEQADDADSNERTKRGRPMHPAQAAAIVSALEKLPDTVPVENLETAERQLVKLARTFTPKQLRDAANRIRNILDTDGPEPDENRAYQRESLTLKPADNGVKFGGYLANENAELFRTLIHSGAKPHKTIDGEPDPRARDKRQADALTTLLTTAATTTHTPNPATTPSTPTTPGNRRTPTTSGDGRATTTADNRSTPTTTGHCGVATTARNGNAATTADRSTTTGGNRSAPSSGNRGAPTDSDRDTATPIGERGAAMTAGATSPAPSTGNRSAPTDGDCDIATTTGDRGTATIAGKPVTAKRLSADRTTAGEIGNDHNSAGPVGQPTRSSTPTGASARTDATPETGDSNSMAGVSDRNTREAVPPWTEAETVGTRFDTASGQDASRHDTLDRYIPGHGPKAHLTITIDFHALRAATADAIGDTVFGGGLSAAAVRRIACDSQVLPVVLGSKSQPLDVGTTKRLITAPMRLALNARDRGCVVCGAPPIQCEAHHLIHWIDGGDTSVSNLVLLCKRHHIDLHAGHWHIRIADGVVHVSRPTWADPAPVEPGRYKPPTHSPADAPAIGHPWPHATTRHQDSTPEAARLAIWGDNTPPTAPEPRPVAPTPSTPGPKTPTPLHDRPRPTSHGPHPLSPSLPAAPARPRNRHGLSQPQQHSPPPHAQLPGKQLTQVDQVG